MDAGIVAAVTVSACCSVAAADASAQSLSECAVYVTASGLRVLLPKAEWLVLCSTEKQH